MDERTTVQKTPDVSLREASAALEAKYGGGCSDLVDRLRAAMEREAGLFTRLGARMDIMRDSFTGKNWAESLSIAQEFEASAREIEKADIERDAAFEILKSGLGARLEESFSAALIRVPEDQRAGLDESWRKLRTSVFRLKTTTGRLRYSAETLAEAFNSVIEGIFPHRRGRIYNRRGAASMATGSMLIDREL